MLGIAMPSEHSAFHQRGLMLVVELIAPGWHADTLEITGVFTPYSRNNRKREGPRGTREIRPRGG